MQIIAVDFDGTLVRNRYPIIENPNEELLKFIRKNRNNYCFILNTCRENQQLQFAVEWLKEQGIVFDYVNENAPWKIEEFGGDCRKIYADYYIDDKAINPADFLETKRGTGRAVSRSSAGRRRGNERLQRSISERIR